MINSFHAASVITLSLEGPSTGAGGTAANPQETFALHFPSLQHLILMNIALHKLDLNVFARGFPGIQRLTCQVDIIDIGQQCNIQRILSDMCFTGGDWERWPQVQVLAASATRCLLGPVELSSMVSMLQDRGSRIRKLLLPAYLVAEADQAEVDGMGRLRELVEVEDYYLDWPRPFAICL
ncbi:hypothetical protein FIBSPDRAFT_493448 [Athelia psychrophila]|uniref:F-box domain-containing protein n=1 Tax=Athelia psychrophila TaxID=1759441 RepID=A0A167TTQ5_9AGAM|nr:hypothetical protein FIBSPDRAFT_493448 [Fibularhizoctonia sp. CBS 109695]